MRKRRLSMLRTKSPFDGRSQRYDMNLQGLRPPMHRRMCVLVPFVWLQLLVCSDAVAADLTQVKEVGPVKVTTRLSPGEPIIGDEITLEITVEAEPDVEVLMPEFGEAMDRYSIVEFVPRQRIDDTGNAIYSQRYTLQPYLSGKQSIPPILVEFVDNRPGQKPSPDDLDAYEILTERIDFHVESVVPKEAAAELKPPLGELELKAEAAANGLGWLVLAALPVGIAAIAGLVVFVRRRRSQAKRRNAYEIARGHLDELLARSHPTNQDEVDEFFVAISGIVRRYLEDRFQLHAPDLTTEEFLELSSTAGELSREHQSLLRDFLRQADLVKFAGVTASREEMQRSSDLAIRFLEETRENAPLVEEAAHA